MTENDVLICTCAQVYKSTIIDKITSNKLTTVEEVGEATLAGTICGQCQEDIQKILDETNSK